MSAQARTCSSPTPQGEAPDIAAPPQIPYHPKQISKWNDNTAMKRHLLLTTLLASLLTTPTFAGFDEGLAAYKKGNYTQALKEWTPLAEQGNATAQYNLGLMYANGQGVPQDYQQAASWYRKAAEQGDASAQNNLGFMYDKGQGVPQDYQQAVSWYRKAAEQGYAPAQYNLGLMYANGQGVPQDYQQAASWYRKAAEQGDASAQNNLGFMYDKGQGVPQDYQQAVSWYRKAAEQGDATAQTNLGAMYYKAQGVPKDFVLAYMLFNLGATGGEEQGSKNREIITKEMTPRQLDEAQALTRNWKVGTPLPTKTKTGQIKLAATNNDEPAPTPVPKKLKACNPPTGKTLRYSDNCYNGDCVRTFENGCQKRFQAPYCYDALSGGWSWKPDGC